MDPAFYFASKLLSPVNCGDPCQSCNLWLIFFQGCAWHVKRAMEIAAAGGHNLLML